MNKTDTKRNINGFSKLSKLKKIQWIAENFFKDPERVIQELSSYWHRNHKEQEIIDGFSENTISNFILPYGVAPNFLINDKYYCVPMVIEESSVVAAASSAAKFWSKRGGFRTAIIDTQKNGQIHFEFHGDSKELFEREEEIKTQLIASTSDITASMEKRGGGILSLELKKLEALDHSFQIFVQFETCDSMGANFINSVLERMARTLEDMFAEQSLNVLMSILSNYNPNCLVKAWVECDIQDLGSFEDGKISSEDFAYRFCKAVQIAREDPYRAVTHNKGIFNGIDAVTLATANDFRAIESGGHAYAARDGQYRSLSNCTIDRGKFHFELTLPLALGTVGGLTKLHPMAKKSLELLGQPNSKELMSVVAATGLAQNFAALRSLVTSGIQKGHMKMHLKNIVQQLEIPDHYHEKVLAYFENKVVSFSAVKSYYQELLL